MQTCHQKWGPSSSLGLIHSPTVFAAEQTSDLVLDLSAFERRAERQANSEEDPAGGTPSSVVAAADDDAAATAAPGPGSTCRGAYGPLTLGERHPD